MLVAFVMTLSFNGFLPNIVASCKSAFLVSSPACSVGTSERLGFVNKVIISVAASRMKELIERIGKSITFGKNTIVSAFISDLVVGI